MSAALVEHWLQAGRLDLPLPASGRTTERWRRLAELACEDLVGARIAEAHADAVAILHELGAKPPQDGQLWAVWAAESPDTVLTASTADDGELVLNGIKPWCSAAGLCTHALVTATMDSGDRALCAVSVDAAITPLSDQWCNTGMARSDTRSVHFTNARAVAVGDPGDYLARPGFWHGAIGVAACWLGGARAVAQPLYERASAGKADPHALAHLGAVDAALAAAEAVLSVAADAIDADPLDRSRSAQRWALRCRATVERAADEAIHRTGRALGPGPLCHDGLHAQRIADLTVYLRQSHAERDLATLGHLAGQQQ